MDKRCEEIGREKEGRSETLIVESSKSNEQGRKGYRSIDEKERKKNTRSNRRYGGKIEMKSGS